VNFICLKAGLYFFHKLLNKQINTTLNDFFVHQVIEKGKKEKTETMAAKRRRTQEQIEAAVAAAAAAEAGHLPSVEELSISMAAFRQNQSELKSMVDVITSTIDQGDRTMSETTSRLRRLEEQLTSQTRSLQEYQKKMTIDIAQQDQALQEMHDTISKFVGNADQALERQQSDATFMMQELNGRMQCIEENMQRMMLDHQTFSRAISNNIDDNESLSSVVDSIRQEFHQERQAMLESFIGDMTRAGAELQVSLQKKIDETKLVAEEQLRTALIGISDSIRSELNNSLAANQRVLAKVSNEAQKFNAFCRIALGHNVKPLNM
jgi:chromosome segregation ATPase